MLKPRSSVASNHTIDVRIELGRTRLTRDEADRLRPGSVLLLDATADGPVDIHIDGRLVGRGELVVVGDRFGVRVTELWLETSLPAAA